jgi:hypothetical protein
MAFRILIRNSGLRIRGSRSERNIYGCETLVLTSDHSIKGNLGQVSSCGVFRFRNTHVLCMLNAECIISAVLTN